MSQSQTPRSQQSEIKDWARVDQRSWVYQYHYWERHDRATYRCPDCGRREDHPHVARFEVHHIDQNPLNNDLSNLVALCRHCHQVRHGYEPTTELEDWKARIHSLGGAES